ncbi:deubiquitinase OTUD6B [Anopheles maculipalpis]|uniref:deubiquitinase OTUD6B n=1 Tax=Anopheles maculipalpis TaxID=1496333 RepID=UPI002158A7B3|nr:deubiquitinase OTUD6B [Anopheles maculipalpis]
MSDSLPETDREEVMARHRKEKKELQCKIQSMKKLKVDKKKKKEILEEIANLELEIEQRHAEELNRLNLSDTNESSSGQPVTSNGSEPVEESKPEASEKEEPRVSKAQRRRDKKAQDNRERDAQIKEEQALLQKSSPRILESNRINEILIKRDLLAHSVPADGDCLYNAINHQLTQLGIGSYSVPELRSMAADYIEANRDVMICYMSNPDTGDMLSAEEFDKYCHQVRATKAWGGEIEIKALSTSLKCPIEVIQATGPATVHGEEESAERKLILTYHRHMYRLGEHYNSTKPPQSVEEEDD